MLRTLLAGLAMTAAVASAQSFSVASVKPSTGANLGTPGTDGGPGTRQPNRYAADTTLRGYIFTAYGLDDWQQQISGPKWIDDDKFEIDARLPEGTTREQFQVMLQNLLAERFKLSVHHETKTIPVYNLVIAKNGPKFKESGAGDQAPGEILKQTDRDDYPVLNGPGLVSRYSAGPNGAVAHWVGRAQPIAALARMLNNPNDAARLVIDKTGLTGKYDFRFSYDIANPGRPAEANAPMVTVFDAMEQQLGLKLVDAKEPVDVVVIDHAERVPVEN